MFVSFLSLATSPKFSFLFFFSFYFSSFSSRYKAYNITLTERVPPTNLLVVSKLFTFWFSSKPKGTYFHYVTDTYICRPCWKVLMLKRLPIIYNYNCNYLFIFLIMQVMSENTQIKTYSKWWTNKKYLTLKNANLELKTSLLHIGLANS